LQHPAPPEISPLSLHDALPISNPGRGIVASALPGGHEGILLVEDESTVRDIAQAALTGLGYRVFTATSGLAALQVWETRRHEVRSEEHTSELQSLTNLVCRLLL